jgi:hypothetical protein
MRVISGEHDRWAWLGLVVLVVGTAGVLAYLFWAPDRGLAGTVIQTAVAVVGLAATAWAWLWRRWKTGVRSLAAHDLARAADVLASAVRSQCQAAIEDRRLLYPAPVSVRWRWSVLPVSGTAAEALGDSVRPRFPPLPGLKHVTAAKVRAGELADLHALYGGLESGRLLIVGSCRCRKPVPPGRMLR